MKKRLIKNLLLVLTMVVLCFAVVVMASAEDRAIIDSGECGAQGDNVTWTLYDDGELVISGEGEMWKDYYDNRHQSPYSNYQSYIKSVVVENGVTTIGRCAFRDLENLQSAIIGNNVVEMGYYAFENCSNLTYINIPDNVEFIGEGSFRGCVSLSEIYLPDNGADIQTSAFQNTAYYNELSNWDNGVLYIDKHLIKVNEDIEGEFTICDGTVAVAGSAFSEQHNLKKINMPNSLRIISEYAFRECIGLKSIVFPKNLTKIGYCAFEECFNLEEVVFPESLKTIQVNSFIYCMGLKEVVIPENVELIGSCAFAYSYFMDKIYVKSMDAEIDLAYALNVSDIIIKDLSREEFIDLFTDVYINNNEEAQANLMEYIEFITDIEQPEVYPSTIYAHSGSTAEKYATELNAPFVPTHFFEGEWTYDYDNMIRYRKCIHCDELETEALETTENGDVDIIAPVDPDTDFTVDVMTDYVIIEETLSENISGDFEIVKAFDINLKNKDGVHVQPDGTVKVKLPVDWTKEGVYKVYRVNDDGTLTDMKAYREGSHMVFDTDHFSVYVIVDESEKVDAPTTPDKPQEETKLTLWEKLVDLIKSFFELTASLFKK